MTGFIAPGTGWAQKIAALIAVAAVGVGCHTTSAPRSDADGDVARADGGRDRPDAVALVDGRPDIPASAQPTPPGNVTFPEPPRITCARQSDCEFPPSACADPSCEAGVCPGYPWVVYYDNPRCTAGSCVFEQRYFKCVGAESCAGGGCIFNGTAAP